MCVCENTIKLGKSQSSNGVWIRLAHVQTRIIGHAHNYTKRARGHIQRKDVWEAAPRSVLLFLGTFDWQFSGSPARSWIICSIFLREISRHLLFTAGTSRRNSSPFLPAVSPSLPSFSVLVGDRIHRCVGMYRECTLTITASRAFIARLGGAHTIAILLAAIKYWCKNRYPASRAVLPFAESPRARI